LNQDRQNRVRILLLECAGHSFCLDMAGVTGILRTPAQALEAVPLAVRLGLAAAAQRGPLIAMDGWFLAAGRPGRMVTLPAESVLAPPPILNANDAIYQAIVPFEGRAIPCLDVARLRNPSPPPLPVRRAQSGRRPEPAAAAGRRIALFPIGPGTLGGVSFRQLLEVLGPTPVAATPRAPEPVAGVVLWRGHAVPVFRLGDARNEPDARLLIVRDPSGGLAALATPGDVSTQRLPFPVEPVPCPPPSGFHPAHLHAAFRVAGDTLVLPNLSALNRAAE